MEDLHDLVIIGAGPAGLTAHLYASMYGLHTVCVGDLVGGKLNLAPEIVDYPGIDKIAGKEYIAHLHAQLHKNGGRIIIDEITAIRKNEPPNTGARFNLSATSGKNFLGKSIFFATGNGNKQKVNRGARLAQSLGVRLENGLFSTDQQGKTNIDGIFAAGDCVVYPNSLEQLVTAVSSAAITVSGVYEFINQTRPPILWGVAKIGRI